MKKNQVLLCLLKITKKFNKIHGKCTEKRERERGKRTVHQHQLNYFSEVIGFYWYKWTTPVKWKPK